MIHFCLFDFVVDGGDDDWRGELTWFIGDTARAYGRVDDHLGTAVMGWGYIVDGDDDDWHGELTWYIGDPVVGLWAC